jgi:hypothetical protein
MPALVCLSPVLADQTVPRFPEQIKIVAVALGNLAEMTADRRVQIVRNRFFLDLLDGFQWAPKHPLKGEIRRHLSNWFLVGGDQTISIDASEVSVFEAHPLPSGSDRDDGLQAFWAEELGRLLRKHDLATGSRGYCIGVACEYAFAGKELNRYQAHSCKRFFPLVGPETCDCTSPKAVLDDAWEFEVPDAVKNADVRFDEAYINLTKIGAVAIRPPSNGSHYEVEFPQGRTWPLDRNHDPVLPQYLAQLVGITGYPIAAIKYALKNGKMPQQRLRMA